MIARSFAALGLLLLPLVARPARALGPGDCDRWIGQLRDEASNTLSEGDDRDALLRRLDDASLHQKGATVNDSAKRLGEFQRKAARLKAAGKLSDSDGVRLQTLAEAARRCVTRLSDLQQGSE
jgi:hypothetical protein